MLIDEVDITVRAGHGGKGKVSFSGPAPDGGTGGYGGDVYVVTTSDLHALNVFSANNKVEAQDGENGGSAGKTGAKGNDTEFIVPIGTSLIDQDSGEIIELNDVGVRIRICKGGIGGRGNLELKNARNTSPKKAQGGRPGEFKRFHASLRYLADYGLVGLPNAGKSSLLNALTNARSKVGGYPFTTLEATLGVLNGKILADIPGLIEGASSGKGLGTKFLKHIEKVKLIIHCIAADSPDLSAEYKVIENELTEYGHDLDSKPRMLLLTKIDLVDESEKEKLIKKLKSYKFPVSEVSIYLPETIENLKTLLN